MTMLTAYCLLGFCIALMTASVVDFVDYSLLGSGKDGQTGLLSGTVVALASTGLIAFHNRIRFKTALTWFVTITVVLAICCAMVLYAEIQTAFPPFSTTELLIGMLIGSSLLRMVLHDKLGNNFQVLLMVLVLYLDVKGIDTEDSLISGIIALGVAFLISRPSFVNKSETSHPNRLLAVLMLSIIFNDFIHSGIQKGLKQSGTLASVIEPLFFIAILIWVWHQRHLLPRILFISSLFIFTVLGGGSLVPEAYSGDIAVLMLASIVLFVIVCIYLINEELFSGYGMRAMARKTVTVISVSAFLYSSGFLFAQPFKMLITNTGPAHFLAKLYGTPFWMGDKHFINLAMNDFYFWANEERDQPVEASGTLGSYFNRLLHWQDPHSHMMQYCDYVEENKGNSVSPGFDYSIDTNYLNILNVFKGSQADRLNLKRGDRIVAINGISISAMNSKALLDDPLSEIKEGRKIDLTVSSSSFGAKNVALHMERAKLPDPICKIFTTASGKKTGYLYFDIFNSAQAKLFPEHFQKFKAEGISSLILDLRYNSGGRLRDAVTLAGYIAGGRFAGKLFQHIKYPDRYHDRDDYVDIPHQQDSADITRLIVLTGNGTVSASETLIKGINPYIKITTIGETTFGKPYVMDPVRFGGTYLNLVTAHAFNAIGESVPLQGISPDISAKDDLAHQLGDPQEGMLKTALDFLNSGSYR